MVRTLARRGAIGAVVTALAVTGMTTAAQAADDPFIDAGTVVGWSADDPSTGAETLPTGLATQAISDVSAGDGFTLTRAVDGSIACFGNGGSFGLDQACDIPASVESAGARSVSAGLNGLGGAVLDDGSTAVWGVNAAGLGYLPTDPWPTDVPAALAAPGSTASLAVGFTAAAAVTEDGRTVAWGDAAASGIADVPAALQVAGSTEHVSLGWFHAVALLSDGSVASWGGFGGAEADLPTALTEPGSTRQALATPFGGVALTTAGDIVTWGGTAEAPSELGDESVRLLASGWGSTVAVTDDAVVEWGGSGATIPDLDADDVVSVASGATHTVAVVRALRQVAVPTVSGTARVGQSLAGTSGTFSGGGTVTQQWFAGDEPIAGADGANLALTADLVGKAISLRSTATKGSASLSSTSSATSAVVDPPAAITAASARVTVVPTTTTAGKAIVTFTAGDRPVNGAATVTLTRGTSVRTAKATIAQGLGTVALPALNQAGTWKLRATLPASSTVEAASTPSYSVAVRATLRKAKVSVTKKPTSKKVGKVRVSFSATGATINGTAKVRVTRGSSSKTVTVKVRNGTGTATLPRLKKGTWRVRATLGSTGTVIGGSTTTVKLTVKK